jgi:hypothetical protein
MAENKTRPTGKDVEAFIEGIDQKVRKADARWTQQFSNTLDTPGLSGWRKKR